MISIPEPVQRVCTREITPLRAFVICGAFGVGFGENLIGRMVLSPWLLLPGICFGLAPVFYIVSPFQKSELEKSPNIPRYSIMFAGAVFATWFAVFCLGSGRVMGALAISLVLTSCCRGSSSCLLKRYLRSKRERGGDWRD